ncbi:5-(carboxyamino)imidazole ribonucleotide synthase [Zavarzinia compransoris]|uniref:N5-carboxyaminoimidazole ribonucleotide synthase n=1 Tax=Zavarzinia compransoris TaxID=1264899 RepID=A0A317E6U7_9PROT|nr:5-(carboxyamino)imidazole ribonucleotide synthase [Zavarzinia compransoris]PWR22282.1 5-(carboxyamino)imidazole ribonucleotide synthase [Zavarzinia compransoris]TDP46955.1 5-(carboxyamino)imidazole ribonucleotide synthase [Zavarzinia compransoris]
MSAPRPAPLTGALLPPGSTLGILGGGQLGRMIALAAANLGYRSHIYGPDADPPAGQVAAAATIAAYDDEAALAAFAAAVDAVTYEFENVPAATVEFLAARKPVRPGAKALAVAQDRVAEKTFANGRGAATAPFRAVDSRADLDAAVAALGLPAVLKTRRLGYDGKGQAMIRTAADLDAAFAAMKGQPAILEGFVDFTAEISVVAARGVAGDVAVFDPVENRHRHHILDVTIAPAPALPAATALRAQTIAHDFLIALDYVGVLAIEFFVTADGALLVNEMAPRVHNSGHWTIEGAETSQFEQAARAALGLPLGCPLRRGRAVMLNLIGDDAHAHGRLLLAEGAHLHLYGKAEARPGRKMGHVTRVLTDDAVPAEAAIAALRAAVTPSAR